MAVLCQCCFWFVVLMVLVLAVVCVCVSYQNKKASKRILEVKNKELTEHNTTLQGKVSELECRAVVSEATESLKESIHLKRVDNHAPGIVYPWGHNMVSPEKSDSFMQKHRKKAIKDGFTLAKKHPDGTETWVKKEK